MRMLMQNRKILQRATSVVYFLRSATLAIKQDTYDSAAFQGCVTFRERAQHSRRAAAIVAVSHSLCKGSRNHDHLVYADDGALVWIATARASTRRRCSKRNHEVKFRERRRRRDWIPGIAVGAF